jgi:hypothetical protein
LSVLEQEYDQLLKRFYKAVEYLDNKEIPLEERKKWLPEYRKILDKLNELVTQMRKRGKEVRL